jgi:hypothetical protein
MDFFKMVYIEIKCPYLTSIPSLSPVKALKSSYQKLSFAKSKATIMIIGEYANIIHDFRRKKKGSPYN